MSNAAKEAPNPPAGQQGAAPNAAGQKKGPTPAPAGPGPAGPGPAPARPGAPAAKKPHLTWRDQYREHVFPQQKPGNGNKLEGELRPTDYARQKENTLGAVFDIREPPTKRAPAKPAVLVIDVGGTHVKLKAPGHDEVKFDSGKELTPGELLNKLKELTTRGWKFDAIAMGYPGPVQQGGPAREPANLGKGWVGFPFEQEFQRLFKKPVRIENDAAMQALGSVTEPGVTLFLGLGTGLGVALVKAVERPGGGLEKTVFATEAGHLKSIKHPHKEYEELVSKISLSEDGHKKWRHHVVTVVKELREKFPADHVIIGGGNVKELKNFAELFGSDESVKAGSNDYAFAGGEAMWGH